MAMFPLLRRALAGFALFTLLLAACSDGSSSGQPDASGTTYHVDCDASSSGDGTIESPWRDFETANAITLEPGDHLLLRRGTLCSGMLKPQGSGTEDKRIVIGAYGNGPLPRIDPQGMETAALHIEDMSHVLFRELELSNPGNPDEPHRGVFLTSAEQTVTNVEIRDLYIHNVTGLVKFSGTAKRGGAIIADSRFVSPQAQFDGVLIENNLIEDVGRSGIYFDGTSASTGDRPRASEGWPAAGQRIVIRGNTLRRLQGDAIVAHGTDSAVIEDNVVSVGNLAGKDWLSPDRNCSAGIWTWNSINTLIQRNEVSGYRFGQSATDGCDGTGFDIDNEQEGTVIQYNYSHNNEGGFILLCSDDEPHTADVRYNLSVDDGKVLNTSPCKAPIVGSFDDIRVYNNTFVLTRPYTALETIPLATLDNAGNFQFANNIVYATSPQMEPMACGDRCTNNLFFQLPPSGSEFVLGDPLFNNVAWRGSGRAEAGEAFRLRPGSPAISAGLGLVVPASQTDFFGNAVTSPPAIGMHQPD
ncbi:MAG: right-handed parallel beta-helix repeat-containing protein [Halioglobus sp.]|nr:right-handed parallel beta-helix repeat-containing protein [Halioglobus sp.]